MQLSVLIVPYHLGHEASGTGAGPDCFLAAGAEEVITKAGHVVARVEKVTLGSDTGHEIGNTFAVLAALAARVRAAHEDGLVPVVLGGNCSTAIPVAGYRADGGSSGLVWLDAHGDANTPETTGTGFFDGMPLAVAAGWCWTGLAATIPGFAPVSAGLILHAGGRAFDREERHALEASAVTVVDAAALGSQGARAALDVPLRRLAAQTSRVHLHLDLDVIDRADGVANEHAETGGAPLAELEAAVLAVGQTCRVRSVTLSSYNPEVDHDRRALHCGLRLLGALVAAIGH